MLINHITTEAQAGRLIKIFVCLSLALAWFWAAPPNAALAQVVQAPMEFQVQIGDGQNQAPMQAPVQGQQPVQMGTGYPDPNAQNQYGAYPGQPVQAPGQPYQATPGQAYQAAPGQPYPTNAPQGAQGVQAPGQPYQVAPGQAYQAAPGQPYQTNVPQGVQGVQAPGQPYAVAPGQAYQTNVPQGAQVPGQGFPVAPGQPYQANVPQAPGLPYQQVSVPQSPGLMAPIVPADPSLPVIPTLSTSEPDPEPKTPEEAAALEVKNETFQKLNKWHTTIMADYIFNTNMIGDPFMPIESIARPPEKQLDQMDEERRRRLPLLQRLTLNQFTVSAIVVASNPDATSALLDSGGRSFIVHRGTLIGPNGGYVKEITPTRVVVEEQIRDYRGQSTPIETVFRLNVLEDDALDEFKIEEGYGG